MSRSGYSDDYDNDWSAIMYRGAVARAFRGKRGQAFLREMLAALDALPVPILIKGNLAADGAVCAIGAVGKARNIDMDGIDPEDAETVSNKFGIAPCMAREIAYTNDDWFDRCSPIARWVMMRRWIKSKINETSNINKRS